MHMFDTAGPFSKVKDLDEQPHQTVWLRIHQTVLISPRMEVIVGIFRTEGARTEMVVIQLIMDVLPKYFHTLQA